MQLLSMTWLAASPTCPCSVQLSTIKDTELFSFFQFGFPSLSQQKILEMSVDFNVRTKMLLQMRRMILMNDKFTYLLKHSAQSLFINNKKQVGGLQGIVEVE